MKLDVKYNKVLKLSNVLILAISQEKLENFQFHVEIEKMRNYIIVHGAKQVGPLIQHSETKKEADGNVKVLLEFMLQCDRIIHNVGEGYIQKPILKVPNCMYCHYEGIEDKIRYAREKIEIVAFEDEKRIKGDSYTVYVDWNQQEDRVVADIFMPVEE